jgi:homoserine kinase
VKGVNALEAAFAHIARRTGLSTPTVRVEVTSEIPMAAGLGSSAAACVAGLRMFEGLTAPLPDSVLLGAAAGVEGHADNAAPALFGGLNSVVAVDGGDPIALRWVWPDDLRLVVATPEAPLATSTARAALAETIGLQDAVFNLQRVLALVHALQSGDYGRIREAVKDRWHQPARARLVPVLDRALSVDDPDVLGVFLSGAGPSVAFLACRHLERIERLVSSIYEREGVAATVRTLRVHNGAPAERALLTAIVERKGKPLARVRGRTA